MPQTAKNILKEAAKVLERDGWGQGFFLESDGRRCIMGAINKVIGIEDKDADMFASDWSSLKEKRKASRAYRLFLKRIGEYIVGLPLEGMESLIVQWNDDEGRSQDEVIRILADVPSGKK